MVILAVIKRTFDIILSSLILLMVSPVLIVLAILVVTKLGQPILFSQFRPGLGGKIFRIYKFRTMTDSYDGSGELKVDHLRLTNFGKVLRSLSLDELPSLFNVLKGDMSLVGPRPLLVEYLPLYTAKQSQRHNVRPGITGWAQVNGRNAIKWEDKFILDNFYVDNQSLWFDIRILFLTFRKVIFKDGIVEEGQVTMSKFTGTRLNGDKSE